jgi:hypothetical protein
MNHITADDALLARLGGIVGPVEIQDENGKVIGHYTPVRTPEEAALYEKARALFDFEEAKRVAATERDQARPTAEVIARLRSMEQGK